MNKELKQFTISLFITYLTKFLHTVFNKFIINFFFNYIINYISKVILYNYFDLYNTIKAWKIIVANKSIINDYLINFKANQIFIKYIKY